MANINKIKLLVISLGALLLASAFQLSADTCLAGTSFVYDGHASRYSASNIDLFSVGTVMGTYAGSWDVELISQQQFNDVNNGISLDHVHVTQASNQWTINPATQGWGKWGIKTTFRAIPHSGSGCTGTVSDSTPSWFVTAAQPVVTGPGGATSNLGVWWLGRDGSGTPLSDNINNYFASGAVIANTGGAPETPAWSVSGNTGAITLSSSFGLNTTATAAGHSASANDIQIGYSVGGVQAVPLQYTANYPKSLDNPSTADNISYGTGYGPGYDTKYSYVVRDIVNNPLSAIAVNETLSLTQQQAGSTWRNVASRSYPSNFEATYYMVDHINYFPNVDDPTPSPAVLSPFDPNASTGPVQTWDQQWRVGCCSDVNTIGYGIYLQSDTLKRNQGNARVSVIQHIPVP